MDIAIIGAGSVGSALGTVWRRAGHAVRFGVRNASDSKVLALASSIGATAHSPREASAASEVVVLATPWPATRSAIESCGDLAGKTVVDCTNPLLPSLEGLELGRTTSGGEQVAQWAKGASVFKCFNQTGAENMTGQGGFTPRLAMFVAGDDAARKPVVMRLAQDAGFEAFDAGPLAISRTLEPLALLWIHLAWKMGMGRQFGFAVVRR